MNSLGEWICQFTPGIGASALLIVSLLAAVLWRGGVLDVIRLGVLNIKLNKPISIFGGWWLLVVSGTSLISAAALGFMQLDHVCIQCEGMPGETAWIYLGEYNSTTGEFQQGPFAVAEAAGSSPLEIKRGSWIKLSQPRKTMILDYPTLGLTRALDSPFNLNGKISYTCKSFPAGQRLYVAESLTECRLAGFVGSDSLELRITWESKCLGPKPTASCIRPERRTTQPI